MAVCIAKYWALEVKVQLVLPASVLVRVVRAAVFTGVGSDGLHLWLERVGVVAGRVGGRGLVHWPVGKDYGERE